MDGCAGFGAGFGDGRHALVTGGSRGIGAAIARDLKARGARVTILGRDQAALEAAVAAGHADQGRACDVADRDALTAALREAEAEAPLAIVVANAGAAETAPLKRLTLEHWDRMLAVNLTAVMLCARATIPAMAARGAGRFIAIASTAGLVGAPYVAAYTAAKHGVVGLVRALGREYATTGVTVNALCPGYVATDLVERAVQGLTERTGRSGEAVRAEMLKHTPLQRFIAPEEVAAAVAWLASPGAAAVTGAAIPIAGGEIG